MIRYCLVLTIIAVTIPLEAERLVLAPERVSLLDLHTRHAQEGVRHHLADVLTLRVPELVESLSRAETHGTSLMHDGTTPAGRERLAQYTVETELLARRVDDALRAATAADPALIAPMRDAALAAGDAVLDSVAAMTLLAADETRGTTATDYSDTVQRSLVAIAVLECEIAAALRGASADPDAYAP